MKILHVVPSMTANGGGPSERVPMTAMAQKKAGLDVAIAFYDDGELSLKAREAEACGVKMVRFAGGRRCWNPVAFSLDFVRRFESVAMDCDVIHTHVQWLFPIWWAAHVALKLNKPLVMMPRGSFSAERLKISKWMKRIVGAIDRHYSARAVSIWATSKAEAGEISSYVPGANVEIFPIGLDVGKFIKSSCNGKILLYFSRISPIKGLDMLAEAWRRVVASGQPPVDGGWKLMIVGPDDRGYAEEIKKGFAEKCPSGSYEFKGPVYGEDKIRLLSSVDAFILPTRNENWGIAVAEAMASALPVICTKGAPWECLETANAGWWTDVSVEGIERALRELILSSSDELRRIGANGRRWTEENLDWNCIGRAMRQSYERLIRRHTNH